MTTSANADEGTLPGAERELSVVVPVFNNARTLEPLHARLEKAVGSLTRSSELIFVNDGSTDESLSILLRLHDGNANVKVIDFSGNFGQNAALAAGLENAVGSMIVSIDADLQNAPEDIPRLVAALKAGADFVSGVRTRREDDFLLRRLPSRVANRIIRVLTGVRLRDFGCGINAVSARVAKAIQPYGGMRKFLKPLVARVSREMVEVEVSHRGRTDGASGTTFRKLLRLFVDILVLFSERWMRVAKVLGGVFLLAALLFWQLQGHPQEGAGNALRGLRLPTLVAGGTLVVLSLLIESVKRRMLRTPLFSIRDIYEISQETTPPRPYDKG